MSAVVYLLDQMPFKHYNICVSDSSNYLDKTSFKESLSKNWNDEHGYDIDLNNRYKEARQFTLNCFIPASTYLECITQYNDFLNEIDKKGSRRLSVIADDLRMEFQVFRIDSSEVKLIYDDNNKVGNFDLKFVENMPVKRVLKSTNKTTTITINSPKVLVINWGDGTQRYTSPGSQVYSKTYADNQTYYPMVLGDIDSIVTFNSNATVLWNKY